MARKCHLSVLQLFWVSLGRMSLPPMVLAAELVSWSCSAPASQPAPASFKLDDLEQELAVGDLLRPDMADLLYDPSDGSVKLDASEAAGGVITNFVLKNAAGGADFNAPGTVTFPPMYVGIFFTDLPTEISASDAAAAGFSGVHDLGNIFPVRMTQDQLELFLTQASYVGALGTGNPSLDLVAVAAPAAADFNQDGVVNAADYAVWRDMLGGSFAPEDYGFWKAHYGAIVGTATVAPEMSTSLLLFAALLVSYGYVGRFR